MTKRQKIVKIWSTSSKNRSTFYTRKTVWSTF